MALRPTLSRGLPFTELERFYFIVPPNFFSWTYRNASAIDAEDVIA